MMDVLGVISLALIGLWSLKVVLQVRMHRRACFMCHPKREDKR